MADITMTKPSRLLEYLPGIYRDSPELGQFLLAFEKVLLGDNDPTLRGIEEAIASVSELFIPNPKAPNAGKTPKEFLPWLADWVVFSLRADIPESKQREFIANMTELYRWRGTKKNMAKLFKIFTNREPTITEPDDDNNPHFFTVLLNLSDLIVGKEQNEVDHQLEIAHALIRLEKPAHTRYLLVPLFPSFQIGLKAGKGKTDFSIQVGKNTRLGVAMWRK
jgi:phage tail-like protein